MSLTCFIAWAFSSPVVSPSVHTAHSRCFSCPLHVCHVACVGALPGLFALRCELGCPLLGTRRGTWQFAGRASCPSVTSLRVSGSARPARTPCAGRSLGSSHGTRARVGVRGHSRVPPRCTTQPVCVSCLSPCAPSPCLRAWHPPTSSDLRDSRGVAGSRRQGSAQLRARAGRPRGQWAGVRHAAGHKPSPNSPPPLARRRRGRSLSPRGPAPSPSGAAPLRAACESGLCRGTGGSGGRGGLAASAAGLHGEGGTGERGRRQQQQQPQQQPPHVGGLVSFVLLRQPRAAGPGGGRGEAGWRWRGRRWQQPQLGGGQPGGRAGARWRRQAAGAGAGRDAQQIHQPLAGLAEQVNRRAGPLRRSRAASFPFRGRSSPPVAPKMVSGELAPPPRPDPSPAAAGR